MTDNIKETLDKVERDIKAAFEQMADDNIKTLQDMLNIQTMAYTLFQHEAGKLRRELGRDHPRVKKLEEDARDRLHIMRGLRVELETAGIRAPKTPGNGAVVHGRVTDKAGRGMPGLTVSAEDGKGMPIDLFGAAETDEAGHFAVSLEGEKLAELKKDRIHLTVKGPRGRILYREEKPLLLKPDGKFVKNITVDLSAAGATGPFSPRNPRIKRPVAVSETAPERETGETIKTDIANIRGVGPKSAERLRRAGISDVETFVKTDDARLKRLLRNVNIQRLKREARTLLERAGEPTG